MSNNWAFAVNDAVRNTMMVMIILRIFRKLVIPPKFKFLFIRKLLIIPTHKVFRQHPVFGGFWTPLITPLYNKMQHQFKQIIYPYMSKYVLLKFQNKYKNVNSFEIKSKN